MAAVPRVFAALDDYELRHLPTHLTEGELEDDLHALLALSEEAADRTSNAWFVAKEAIGDGQGYIADIELATRRSAARAEATAAAGEPVSELGLELRYALIRSALTTLTVNLPGEFLVALVEHERWTIGHALANARLQPDPWSRGSALALLGDLVAPNDRQALLEEAFALVLDIPLDASEPWGRGNLRALLLETLATRLPAELIDAAIERAEELTAPTKHLALVALAARLSEQQRRDFLRERLKEFGDDCSAAPFHLLAATAPEDLLPELVQLARAIDHPYQRSEALIALIERLISEEREAVLSEVRSDPGLTDEQRCTLVAGAARHLPPHEVFALIEAVQEIEWDSGRIRVWATLVCGLTGQAQERALEAALADADGINSETGQFAVSDIATILPLVPADERRDRLLAVALEALSETQDNAKQAALAELAPLLPPELLDQALEHARSFTSQEYFWSLHARALIALAAIEPRALIAEELERLVEHTRTLESDEAREYVLEALDDLNPRPSPAETPAPRALPRRRRLILRVAGAAASLFPGQAKRLLFRWQATEDTRLLEMLSLRLRGPLGATAVGIAEGPDDAFQRGRLLTRLLPYLHDRNRKLATDGILALPEERAIATFIDDIIDVMSEDQVAATLKATERFEDPIERARVLSILMPRLHADQQAPTLNKIITLVTPEEKYRDMLSYYTETFGPRLSRKQIAEIEHTARARRDIIQRFDLLRALLPRRGSEHDRNEALIELLHCARQIEAFSDRRNRLEDIASQLTKLPRSCLLGLWHELLAEISIRRREHLLADIAGLAPVIGALGGFAAVAETAHAVRDVAEWWP